ncbi:MAG: hypothetical protein AB7K52_07750 [Phycisphaerales bacterium]
MPSRSRSRLSLRSTGLIVAAGVFLIASGIVGLVAVWNRQTPGDGPARSLKPPAVMPPVPVDIDSEGLRGAGRARVQFVSRSDPGKAIGHLGWASLEPSGPGRARVVDPRGEIYVRAGGSIRIAAARGTILYPAGLQQLESGTFEGGVTVEYVPGGQADEAAPATLRIFAPTITFSAVSGEVSTNERFRASAEQFEVAARGLRLIGNQVDNTLELLEMGPPEYVWLAPHRRSPADAAAAGAGTPSREGGVSRGDLPPAVTDAAKSVRETFYHAVAREEFRVTRRGLRVDADRLELWARFVNGALAPGAIGQAGNTSGVRDGLRAATAPAPEVAPPGEPLMRTPPISGEPPSLFTGLDDPDVFVARWGGPLVVRPMETRPPELTEEEIAAAFRSSAQRRVEIIERDVGAAISAAAIDYAATSMTLGVAGSRGSPARLELAGKGRLQTDFSRLSLRTGVGLARGPSRLEAAASTADRPTDIAWTDQADFEFHAPDAAISDRLKSARFNGNVTARDGSASLQADSAAAEFASFEHPEGPLEALLSRVQAQGRVRARDAGGGTLEADALTLELEPVGRSADPRDLSARGNVRASRGAWTIAGGALDATLARDERGQVVVSRAEVRERAIVESTPAERAIDRSGDQAGRVRAEADQIIADVDHLLVDLLGERVTITRDEGSITGTQMRLDGERQELFVFGAGELTLRPEPRTDPLGTVSPPADPLVTARWDRSMSFNNLEGSAECVGNARAVAITSPVEETTLLSEVIRLRFTPEEPASPGAIETPGSGALGALAASREGSKARRLLRAEAIGASFEREGGARASIESRRFAPAGSPIAARPGESRPIERLFYIEGDRLIADETEHLIEVPGPGRLLVDDRRTAGTPALPAPQPGALPADLSGVRGTTLFHWTTGLRYDRDEGLIRLLGGVRALHRDAPDQPVISIDADDATARVLAPTSPVPAEPDTLPSAFAPGRQAELLSATCEGNVVISLPEGARVEARRASLDTRAGERGVIEASATEPDWVIFTTPDNPSATQCRAIFYDLARRQPRIVGPAPVVVPR